jgi:NAD+ kinase
MATPSTGRSGSPITVGIVARPHSPNATAAARDATAWLQDRDTPVVLDRETARSAGLSGHRTTPRAELPGAADVLLVLGGDGTLLSVAHPVARRAPNTLILAVNCGSLGFLTEITRPEMHDALDSVLTGRAGIDERLTVRARVRRGGRDIADRTVLNDVVIGRSADSGIIDVSITLRDRLVTSCRADGVIVATPTGSTGYNLAAGGPIVHPTVDALIVTPIAPHTLTNRPVVIPDREPLTLRPKLDGSRFDAFASFDGQLSVALEDGDEVVVERSTRPLRLVRAESRDYFAVLREKLKWGER